MRKNANNHRNMKTLPAFNSAIHNSLITSIISLTNAGKKCQVHCKNVMSGMKFVWVIFVHCMACVLQIDDDDGGYKSSSTSIFLFSFELRGNIECSVSTNYKA